MRFGFMSNTLAFVCKFSVKIPACDPEREMDALFLFIKHMSHKGQS